MAAENTKNRRKSHKASEILQKGLLQSLTLVLLYGIRAEEKEHSIV